jgi:Derlin-2/3
MPWVLFAFSLLLSGSVPMNDLIGIAAGHCYFFVYDLIPQIYHVNLLSAPKLMYLCSSWSGSF